jgi:hypothetical protein
MATQTFFVTLPDGTVETRTSETMKYTHVAACQNKDGSWGVRTWSKSAENAAKSLTGTVRRHAKSVQVIEIQKVEQGRPTPKRLYGLSPSQVAALKHYATNNTSRGSDFGWESLGALIKRGLAEKTGEVVYNPESEYPTTGYTYGLTADGKELLAKIEAETGGTAKDEQITRAFVEQRPEDLPAIQNLPVGEGYRAPVEPVGTDTNYAEIEQKLVEAAPDSDPVKQLLKKGSKKGPVTVKQAFSLPEATTDTPEPKPARKTDPRALGIVLPSQEDPDDHAQEEIEPAESFAGPCRRCATREEVTRSFLCGCGFEIWLCDAHYTAQAGFYFADVHLSGNCKKPTPATLREHEAVKKAVAGDKLHFHVHYIDAYGTNTQRIAATPQEAKKLFEEHTHACRTLEIVEVDPEQHPDTLAFVEFFDGETSVGASFIGTCGRKCRHGKK